MGTTRRAGITVLAASAALTLSGCWPWSAPVGEPTTPEPVTVTPTPVAQDALELAAEQCGEIWSAPISPFTAELDRPEYVLPAGMTIATGLRVVLEAEHGSHSVDATRTGGVVLDDDGEVAGLVVAFSVPGTGRGSGPSISWPAYVTVGACPGDGLDLGDPLPDGAYSLLLSGPINPRDHDHAVGETWLTNALPLEVADGEITP